MTTPLTGLDLREDHINALLEKVNELVAGGGGGGGGGAELSITPEGPWYEAPGTFLTAGTVNSYSDHPHLETRTVLCVKGADNQGTTFTGVDSTGISPGDIRLFMDVQETGHQDVGTILFKHEDTGSPAADRFMCPGQYDYIQAPNGMTWLQYGEDLRWHILSNNGRYVKVLTQSLQFYPKSLVGQATPVSGTVHNYEPTGWAGFGGLGISGTTSAFKNHSMVEFIVDAAGLTVTGFKVQSLQADPAYYGAVKVISNRGPGVLTLKYQSASSDAENRIYTPNSEDVVLQAGEAAWIFYGYYDPDTTQPGWRVIGLCQNRSTFVNLTATGRAKLASLSITPMATPAVLPAGRNSDVVLGAGTTVKLIGTAPYSSIDSIVPEDAATGNEMRLLRNAGPVPLVFIDSLDSAGTAANRISLPQGGMTGATSTPASVHMLLPNQEMWIQYNATDSRWNLCGPMCRVHETNTVITPSAFPATNVDDYSPTDSTSTYPGRYAATWFVQGAVGTVLRGIKYNPTSLAPFKFGDRLILVNLGSGMTIKNNDAGSAAGNRFVMSGDIILSASGMQEFMYSGGSWLAFKP